MPLSIKEALAQPADKNVTLMVQCVEVGELIRTGDKHKFYVVIADGTASTTATVYHAGAYENFMKGQGLLLQNVINKQSYFAVTSKSKSGIMPAQLVPPEILADVPSLPKDGVVSISTSMNSPNKTYVSVRGKIMKMTPKSRKSVADSILDFQEALIKDKTYTTKVALWGDLVDVLEVGDLVTIRKARVRLFSQAGNEEKKLTTTVYTKLEKMNEHEDLDIEPLTADEDRLLSTMANEADKGTLIALMYADTYFGCYKTTCLNVMTNTIKGGDVYKLECPSCGNVFPAAIATRCAILRFLLEEDDGKCTEITTFSPIIEEIFKIKGLAYLPTMDISELKQQAIKLLPMAVKYTLRGSVLQSVDGM